MKRAIDCAKIQELLSDYLDSKLSTEAMEQAAGHIAGCPACKQRLNELKTIIGLLKSVKEKPLPSYYRTQLDAKLDEAAFKKAHTPSWSRFKWQIVFGVFMLGIFAGSGILFVSQKSSGDKCPYTIKLGEVGILTFNLYSKENVKTIVFNVELPEGLALASKPKDKTFKWKGELVKGENVISLYVRALKEGRWAVNAKLQADEKTIKEFKMPLCVTDKKG